MAKESESPFAEELDESKDVSIDSSEQKESEGLKERLSLIVRTISGKPELEVTTEADKETLLQKAAQGQDANKQWYRQTKIDPRTRKVVKEIVHIPKDILLEDETEAKGKAAHEAGHVAITRMEFIPEKVMQELGFHSLMVAAEERPTDEVVRQRYAGAGTWVDAARQGSVAEGEEQRQKLEKEMPELAKRLPIPKFEQLCELIVYEPHYDELPKDYDPEVVEIYEKIRNAIERVEHTLPREGSQEKEAVAKAKERYKMVYKEAWPHVKRLMKKDTQDEALRQMKPDLQKQALDDELRKMLMKAFLALPKEEQEKLLNQAKKILEEVEDTIVESLSGKLVSAPDTHKEFRERKEKEAKEKERDKAEEENIKKDLEDIEKKQEELGENKSQYEKAYQKVHELDELIYNRLQEVFKPNIKRKMKLTSSGSKINLQAVYRWTSTKGGGAKTIDNRIFETLHIPQEKDYAITILVDLSGSMHGEKIEETFKAVVLLTEVVNRLGIPFEILGFQDIVLKFKDFGQEVNDKVRERISQMIQEVSSTNPGGHNESGFNDDGPCLQEASRRLESQPGKEKFLLVFSDGLPAGSHSNEADLSRTVKNILTTTQQKLIGLGLGKGTEHVKKFYPTSLPNIDVKKLSEVLGDLLEDMIRNPQGYAFQINK